MSIHVNDIINSPLNKEQIEVSSKDIDLKDLRQSRTDQNGDGSKRNTVKPTTVITVKKTLVSQDGSKTEFNTKMEQTFSTAQEMREYLEVLGYSGNRSIWRRFIDFVRGNWKV